ncbi:trichohyalin-like [Mercenaria mercenaria]|uniref:trichohyalin-like n=1 Tax=Mercenaria mercenaria TaxID=6596 RepID=UPI00234F5F07|nr:trichohyalin-like [Mercenaria mercenaria]
MAHKMSERELRCLKRDKLRQEIAEMEKALQDRIEKDRLETIKERDREIQLNQFRELQRQRSELETKRKEAKQRKERLRQMKEDEQRENREIDELIERKKQLDLEVERIKVVENVHENDNKEESEYGVFDETDENIENELNEIEGAYGYDNEDEFNDLYTDEYMRDDVRYKDNAAIGRSLVTVDNYGNIDAISSIGSDRQSIKSRSKRNEQDELHKSDTHGNIFRRLDKTKEREKEIGVLRNSEDRIKKKEVKGMDDVKIEYGKHIKQEDEIEDEQELIKQIEQMKLQEKRMIEDIKRKERLKEVSRQKNETERLLEEKRKLKEERMRKWKQVKNDLEQSLLEKESTISMLDEELKVVESPKQKLQKKSTAENNKLTQPLIYKPSVPKLTDLQYFREWKAEVQSMLESKIYHTEVIEQAVRNSISGRPRKILSTMKATATIEEILQTLDSNFGNTKSGESIMEGFYTAKQEKDEDIAA